MRIGGPLRRDRTHRFLDLKDPLVSAVVRVAHNVVEPALQELKGLISFRVTMVVGELRESLTFVERDSQLWMAQQEESRVRRSRYVPLARHEPIETGRFRRLIPLFRSVFAIQPGVECSGDAARFRRPQPQLQSYWRTGFLQDVRCLGGA